MDFTLRQYSQLLENFIKAGYSFQTFGQFIKEPLPKTIILRHDIDRLPENSIHMAKIESGLGVKGSYYFRTTAKCFKEEIICMVANLDHEIGYHYETMETASKRLKKVQKQSTVDYYDLLIDDAYNEFCINLEQFRKIVPISTVCMHGSPLSKFDNRDMWKKYDYRGLGIIGEPYFDVDYSKVYYITDTGRKWNNLSSNVRDKVNHSFDIPIKSTAHLISLISQTQLPVQIMLNTHPHRWFEDGSGWYRELFLQSVKNVVKRVLLFFRDEGW